MELLQIATVISVLQSAMDSFYKLRQFLITNKVRHGLLQIVTSV